MDAIIALPPETLYTKALEYKKNNDWTNCIIYLTMSANYDYQPAIDIIETHQIIDMPSADKTIVKEFYKKTIQYSYSMVFLANLYRKKNDEEYNCQKAVELFQKAADLGNSIGIIRLGLMYYKGLGVERNTIKAIELAKRALELGNVFASANLGIIYHSGIGIVRNYESALMYYEKAIIVIPDAKSKKRIINNIKKIAELKIPFTENVKSICERLILTDKLMYTDKLPIIKYYKNYLGLKEMMEQIYSHHNIKRITDENEALKTHIAASPDGELYLAAQEHWNSCTH